MKNLRFEVIRYAKLLNSRKLSALRSGNISTRYKDGFLITPSGKKYSSLKNKDIIFVNLKGKFDKKMGIPSSEWRFHQDIYLNKKDARAIVHAHSNYATAISTHGKSIPAFHYMIAMAGGIDIKCAKYATYGTRELSKNILKALKFGKDNGGHCIGFTGKSGGKMEFFTDICLKSPTKDMLAIEAQHVMLCHCIISSLRNLGTPLFKYE